METLLSHDLPPFDGIPLSDSSDVDEAVLAKLDALQLLRSLKQAHALLRLKERDLNIAAEIGQNLLQANSTLKQAYEDLLSKSTASPPPTPAKDILRASLAHVNPFEKAEQYAKIAAAAATEYDSLKLADDSKASLHPPSFSDTSASEPPPLPGAFPSTAPVSQVIETSDPSSSPPSPDSNRLLRPIPAPIVTRPRLSKPKPSRHVKQKSSSSAAAFKRLSSSPEFSERVRRPSQTDLSEYVIFLEKSNTDLQTQLQATLDQHKKSEIDHRGQVDQLLGDIEDLRFQLSKAEDLTVMLESDRSRLVSEKMARLRESASIEQLDASRIDTLSSTVKDLQTANSKLERAKREEERRVQQLKAELDQVKNSDLDNIKRERQTYKELSEKQALHIAELTLQLFEHQARNQALAEEIAELSLRVVPPSPVVSSPALSLISMASRESLLVSETQRRGGPRPSSDLDSGRLRDQASSPPVCTPTEPSEPLKAKRSSPKLKTLLTTTFKPPGSAPPVQVHTDITNIPSLVSMDRQRSLLEELDDATKTSFQRVAIPIKSQQMGVVDLSGDEDEYVEAEEGYDQEELAHEADREDFDSRDELGHDYGSDPDSDDDDDDAECYDALMSPTRTVGPLLLHNASHRFGLAPTQRPSSTPTVDQVARTLLPPDSDESLARPLRTQPTSPFDASAMIQQQPGQAARILFERYQLVGFGSVKTGMIVKVLMDSWIRFLYSLVGGK
ncbi:uncharacterized protein BJ171DRAFT_486079 [Polychytrium aggregatum]|uniref:uncharacterized protein n=1 Tax=Polychytrium aggregatum TaxID=110093 RepID=UPI0022FDE613|nr:uncharacterized protein BJ171DRAFT_486079 [Polychytrium aggregatum]KAI9209301.1 hypothetical protein BJ171DRAFT_486079 [Polychytrium aggregatum]